MSLKSKLLYSQNWNIGFCELTIDAFLKNKELGPVRWLRHPYRDRWFADPFIYEVTEKEIVVFVEECPILNPKGIICELVINRKTMSLKERHVMLELDTHLSYPAFVRKDGMTYVYPENGASGSLLMYKYNKETHQLVNPVCILDEAVADASIVERDGRYYMSATLFPDTQKNAYLYESESLFGPFNLVSKTPYQTSIRCSRQGGNWFETNGRLYRPSQDCAVRYGAAMSIRSINGDLIDMQESELFHINPKKGRYSLGLHTFNHLNGICVIDGYGYLYPLIGRVYEAVRDIKHFIVG